MNLVRAVEGSLTRLGVEQIDIMYLDATLDQAEVITRMSDYLTANHDKIKAIIGLGDMNENSFMVQLGWFTPQEIATARQEQGVVGDLAGYSFFNIQGKPVDTVMNDRVIGLSLEQLRAIPCVIAIASESTKATAILGALRTGVIDVLATSASNARSVINMQKAL